MSRTNLTVDDSATVRQMVTFTLKAAGYGVIEAQDGQDALGKRAQPLAMVATDLNTTAGRLLPHGCRGEARTARSNAQLRM